MKIFYMLIIVVVAHLACLLKLTELCLLIDVNYTAINLIFKKA